eukprot:TRINITY_DN397_c0_g1_i3.p2 TRINITY_DN397_c0_g1~~TRINITY_DN397_c0_g1_i3.p2  ORF type:complete len:182 (+),score=8.19 TRINITY_DN397_c0_g1_i3:477-1022(+)
MALIWSPLGGPLIDAGSALLVIVGLKGKHEVPGKSGLRQQPLGFEDSICNSSANIHPTDHISMAEPYTPSISITSGALYHLETTCLVKWVLGRFARLEKDMLHLEKEDLCRGFFDGEMHRPNSLGQVFPLRWIFTVTWLPTPTVKEPGMCVTILLVLLFASNSSGIVSHSSSFSSWMGSSD